MMTKKMMTTVKMEIKAMGPSHKVFVEIADWFVWSFLGILLTRPGKSLNGQ